MGKRKTRKLGPTGAIALAVAIVVMMAVLPDEIRDVLGFVLAVLLVYWLIQLAAGALKSRSRTAPPPRQQQNPAKPGAAPQPASGSAPKSTPAPPMPTPLHPEPLPASQPVDRGGFGIPKAPAGFGPGRWISPSETVEIAGTRLTGGMIYVGSSLPCVDGTNDPCLIDPTKHVAKIGDFTTRQTEYWPSYSGISPNARRAYLDWLSSGRSHPDADAGFVFLFFYGLERRIAVDATADPLARQDLPLIAAELKRLLAIYGDKSPSFLNYAGKLMILLTVLDSPFRLYNQPLPPFTRSHELPIHVKLALGTAAADAAPVPAPLALAWIKLAPQSRLRAAAVRCPDEFATLFLIEYAKTFGPGIVLPGNRAKLKVGYTAASSALRRSEILIDTVPDVALLTKEFEQLLAIAETTTLALEAYSRIVARSADAHGSFEALLTLPTAAWPATARASLNTLKEAVGAEMLPLPYGQLLSMLGATESLTKSQAMGLANVLGTLDICVEPDLAGSTRLPKPDDVLVLFPVPAGDAASEVRAVYADLVLTLQFVACVAAADGAPGAAAMDRLARQVALRNGMAPAAQERIHAYLLMLSSAAPSVSALTRKVAPLDSRTKASIATFLASAVASDVTTAQIKLLQRFYTALGVDPAKALSDVHTAAAGNAPAANVASVAASAGFQLDAGRIATLQRDSDKVSTLLAGIFQDDEAVPSTTRATVVIDEPAADTSTSNQSAASSPEILGLDNRHGAFARLLLTRPEWSRAELQSAAAGSGLMLDGALEKLNDAAFDTHGVPFAEGDDPLTINQEIVEMPQQ